MRYVRRASIVVLLSVIALCLVSGETRGIASFYHPYVVVYMIFCYLEVFCITWTYTIVANENGNNHFGPRLRCLGVM